jgi:hypothetical protein
MNLDDELRRLFADERLDLAVRPDAELTIVAGARRIRRRRFVAGTVAAVAVAMVVGSGIALAGAAGPESVPAARTADPVVPTTMTTVPTTTTTPVTSATSGDEAPEYALDTIGPWTYGPLRLSMSEAQARDTGLLGAVEVTGECVKYRATYGGDVVVSKKYGVVIIRVSRPVSTAKGVHVGSMIAEVKAAYPGFMETRDGLQTETGAGFMTFAVGGSNMHGTSWPDTGVVERIVIGSSHSDCALAY